jgi:hypothetical protein
MSTTPPSLEAANRDAEFRESRLASLISINLNICSSIRRTGGRPSRYASSARSR